MIDLFRKKAQLTFFFVLIILFILIGIFAYYPSSPAEPEATAPLEVRSIQSAITDCLGSELNRLITLLAAQGGFIAPPDRFHEAEISDETGNYPLFIPYYLADGDVSIQSLADIEVTLADAMQKKAAACANPSRIPEIIVVDAEKSSVTTHVGAVINVAVHLPLTLKVGNTLTHLSDFQVRQPSFFTELYAIAVNLTQTQQAGGDLLCVSCIRHFAEEKNLGLRINEIENEDNYEILYSLNKADNKLIFNFAHYFTLQGMEVPRE